MSKTFLLAFSDGQLLTIDDIIDFEQFQIDEIRNIASRVTEQALIDARYGKDISSLTRDQKGDILSLKNTIVGQGTSDFLYDNDIVLPGKHSLKRIFERLGSDARTTVIGIIDKIKLMNQVHKAQWKGFPQLSYTLKLIGDQDRYKASICFEPIMSGDRIIKMITISNVKPSELSDPSKRRMEQRLNEDPKMAEMMERIRKQFGGK